MTDICEDDVALSFKQLGISSLVPPQPILSNVSGFVKKGGITAIMGASAAGKSVLMQVLAGRLPSLHVTGEVTLNGLEMDITNPDNALSYVPQDDFLMGELTPRETLANSARMKRETASEVIDREVDDLLRKFGLDHVADNAIGTVFVRGLSGGQRKRVEVCSELISPHSVLMLDEPTSGLDGAIAYEVLAATKRILESKKGSLSLMISIHQPNSRILSLFDHILLVGGGGMIFFGTVPESIAYFSSIGFPPPEIYTPTDVFLQVSDANFGENHDFDFEGSFACSAYNARLNNFLEDVKRLGVNKSLQEQDQILDIEVVKAVPVGVAADEEKTLTLAVCQWCRQFWTLLSRDFTLAYRDPSLYYLQFVLVCAFGFLVGATFFHLKAEINAQMTNISGGLLWIVMMVAYIQVFKVYHLSRSNQRFKHEVSNNTYAISAYWAAEVTATGILLISFIPGTIVAYFMMQLPPEGYPFLILLFWMTALSAESMLHFITKFSEDATVSIVSSQAAMVILTVFGGGVFIAWDQCPDYWVWLQEISIFTQASRAAIMNVNDYLDYDCVLNGAGQCVGPLGDVFPCDVSYSPATSSCVVSGRAVLHTMQGTIENESKWIPFGYLVLIFASFRLLSLCLMYFPVQKILYSLQRLFGGHSARDILDVKLSLRRVEGQLNAYIALHQSDDANKGLGGERRAPEAMLSAREQHGEDDVERGATHSPRPQADASFKKLFHSLVDTDLSDGAHSSLMQPLAHGPCLEWKDLSVVLQKKQERKVLVDSVSGVALPGRILALMGPSGAGKTTLLNALSNRAPYAKLEGSVMFAHRPFAASDLVYVPQFDEFNANLTVYEQIGFVGEMKCRDTRDMRKRLNHLLTILGLAAKAKTPCRELTSGELKRVSVGMGMISNPNVLFLDEPTTGLDSSAAYSIVKYLAELSAATRVVVIMTIHQPAPMVFDLLQDLYLLEKGRLAYFGPLQSTKKFFCSLGFDCPADVNPADFYLDLVSASPADQLREMKREDEELQQSPGKAAQRNITLCSGGAEGQRADMDKLAAQYADKTWTELYLASRLHANLQAVLDVTLRANVDADGSSGAKSAVPPSFASRFYTLTVFFSRYYSRDAGFYYLRIGFLAIIAIFIGTLFLQLDTTTAQIPQYSGAIFFNIWTALFSAVAATGLMATDRRQAIEQVKNAVMTPSVYCLAQFVVSFPFNFVASVVYQSIFHWLIDINPRGESFIFAIMITWGHLLLMEAIMLSVVAALKNAMLSVTFAMVVLGYLFLFSGFFIPVENMPPSIFWISYITPTKYSFDGYLWQIYSTQSFNVPGFPGFEIDGKTLLDSLYKIKDVNSWGMFGTLLAWVVLFRLVHYTLFLIDVWPYLAKPAGKA